MTYLFFRCSMYATESLATTPPQNDNSWPLLKGDQVSISLFLHCNILYRPVLVSPIAFVYVCVVAVNTMCQLSYTIPPCMEATVTRHTGFVVLLKSVSVTVTQGWLLVSHGNFLLSMP